VDFLEFTKESIYPKKLKVFFAGVLAAIYIYFLQDEQEDPWRDREVS
jgi:hypothetical protein